jgi:hypothetical protein
MGEPQTRSQTRYVLGPEPEIRGGKIAPAYAPAGTKIHEALAQYSITAMPRDS